MFDLFWVSNFIKIGHTAILRSNLSKFLTWRQDPQFQVSYLWLTNLTSKFHSIILGTKFSWNKGIDTCFNVECVLLSRSFGFLGGYLVVTARYLVVTVGYYLLPGGYWWLLLVTACYCLFPLLVWTTVCRCSSK